MERMTIGEFARESRLSPKALRLYDELGVLVPAHVDPSSGYRLYDPEQLEAARLVGSLRHLGLSLAQIRATLGRSSEDVATIVSDYWAQAELDHESRRELARYLVDTLKGNQYAMPEVTTEQVPERSILCLKRQVEDEQAVWDMGKEFVGIFKSRPAPRVPGSAFGWFLIYHGEVNADSDGPVECCLPVPGDQAEQIAADYPELILRTERAHEEASVHLGPGGQIPPAAWQVATDALRQWADDKQRRPSALGVRITYQLPVGRKPEAGPDCSFAVPLA